MLILIIASLVGFFLSLILHLLGLFNIYSPPRLIGLLLQLGILLIFLFWCFISKKNRGNTPSKEFNESLWKSAPEWIKITTGIFVLYALFGFLHAFIEKNSSGSSVVQTDATESIGSTFPSHWIALYAVMFTLFYGCKCLIGKIDTKKSESDFTD